MLAINNRRIVNDIWSLQVESTLVHSHACMHCGFCSLTAVLFCPLGCPEHRQISGKGKQHAAQPVSFQM
jgi:hypothetical protein